MIERYLKLLEFVDKATSALYTDNFSFEQLKRSLPLTGAQVETILSVITVLGSVKQDTTMLEGKKQTTLHLRDVVLAGVLKNWVTFENNNQPGSVTHVTAKLLRIDILRR